jgi:hypothetical protein
MQETIKRWGLGGLILGAIAGFAIVLVDHIRTGVIKSIVVYPLMMGTLAVPCALLGLICGLFVALGRRR